MLSQAFGCKTSFEKSPLILVPLPWSATASYGLGTEKASHLIRKASEQLDFFNPLFNCSYNDKIHFLKEDLLISSLNQETLSWVKELREREQKASKSHEIINESCQSMIDWVYEQSLKILSKKKIPALVGGDHSVSQGLLQALGEHYKGDYGILHLDAHADLRVEYEGFKYSHASIMYNVLQLDKAPEKIVQVAVRDFCKEEYDLIRKEKKIECFFDEWIYNHLFKGQSWAGLCAQIISKLPAQVYVSLDVDALSWAYAPDTGTPVPGGLSFNQTLYLLAELKKQNKKVIGFDVVETAGSLLQGENRNQQKNLKSKQGKKELTQESLLLDKLSSHRLEWNGNVSARLLYSLSGLALHSFKKI